MPEQPTEATPERRAGVTAPKATLVAQVTATIGGTHGDDATGPIDVSVLPDGSVELNLGSTWATLTCDAARILADALLRAGWLAHTQTDPAIAHLRREIEGLGLTWQPVTDPTLDEYDAACKVWGGYTDQPYGRATTADIKAFLRAMPNCGHHVAVLERGMPDPDPYVLALAEACQ